MRLQPHFQWRVIVVVIAASVLAMLGVPAVAFAQPTEFLSVSPTSGPPGAIVTVVGTGFTGYGPNFVARIDISVNHGNGNWDLLESGAANPQPDANGNFTAQITIPSNAPPGALLAIAAISSQDPFASFTVNPSPSATGQPTTTQPTTTQPTTTQPTTTQPTTTQPSMSLPISEFPNPPEWLIDLSKLQEQPLLACTMTMISVVVGYQEVAAGAAEASMPVLLNAIHALELTGDLKTFFETLYSDSNWNSLLMSDSRTLVTWPYWAGLLRAAGITAYDAFRDCFMGAQGALQATSGAAGKAAAKWLKSVINSRTFWTRYVYLF